MNLSDLAIYFADDIQEWSRHRDQWQAKLIKAFHAVENGNTDPFAGNDPHWPVPDYIRRDFVDYCKRGIYVIHPEMDVVWDTKEGTDVIDAFVLSNYDPAIRIIDSLLNEYYNYYDRRESLIKAIDRTLQDLAKDFGEYLHEYYGVDIEKPLIKDQIPYFVVCSVTNESLLTYLEDDFTPELFDEWAKDFTEN